MASTCQATGFTTSVWLSTSRPQRRRAMVRYGAKCRTENYMCMELRLPKDVKKLQRKPALVLSMSGHFLEPRRFLKERLSKLHSEETPRQLLLHWLIWVPSQHKAINMSWTSCHFFQYKKRILFMYFCFMYFMYFFLKLILLWSPGCHQVNSEGKDQGWAGHGAHPPRDWDHVVSTPPAHYLYLWR